MKIVGVCTRAPCGPFRRAAQVAAIAATIVAGAQAPLSGQDRSDSQVRLVESVCEDCLQVRRVLTIGDLSGPAGLGSTFAMTRQPDTGEFLYSSNRSRGEILRFDARGTLIETLGGQGEGPEEFRWITELHAGRSRLDAIDMGNIRWTTLYTDRRTAATRRLPRPAFSSAVIGDSVLVANIDIRTRSLVGLPYHIVSPSGEILRSFGEDPQGYRSDIVGAINRQIAASGSSHFWAAPPTEYRLQRWDLDGKLTNELFRSVPWFAPHNEGMVADPDSPPAPWIIDVREVAGGVVSVMILVADEAWYEGIVPQSGEGGYTWRADRTDFLDTVVELIDPARGVVLAHARWDFAAAGFVDDEHLAVYRETDGGVPSVDVWQITFSQGRTSSRSNFPKGDAR